MSTEVPAWVTLAGLEWEQLTEVTSVNTTSKTEELKSASVEEKEVPAWIILNEYPY